MSIADRITEYLSVGGLFNPEIMEHDKVRDLLMDCRGHIVAIEALLDRVPHEYVDETDGARTPLRCWTDCPACAWLLLKKGNA